MRNWSVDTHDLIVSIVKRGCVEKVIEASKRAGAEGGTIIPARGTGIREGKRFMGMNIEPEKEILLTLTPKELTDPVLSAIVEAGEFKKPGTGVGFVIELKKVVGIVHYLESLEEE